MSVFSENLKSKTREIAALIFCEINDKVPSFSLDLAKAQIPCETPKMECFAKIANSWIQSTIFANNSILDVLLSSEYVSDYLRVFSIIMSWGYHFEFSKNLSNFMSILFKYLEQKFTIMHDFITWNMFIGWLFLLVTLIE